MVSSGKKKNGRFLQNGQAWVSRGEVDHAGSARCVSGRVLPRNAMMRFV